MQTLENFVFSSSPSTRYPWDTILDGQAHLLVRGEDYNCEDGTISQMARNRAKKAGKGVRIAKHEKGTVICAVPLPSPKEEKAPATAPGVSPAPASSQKGKGKTAAA